MLITNLLNNNSVSTLPAELLSLQHVTELNVGNNALNEVPAVLGHLESLKKLYLFSNQIIAVPPDAIDGLRNLVVLNLNHNQIQRLPPEIKSCMSDADAGEYSVMNQISPNVCCQLYQCKDLTKLHVARNKLTSPPEGIGALAKLQVLEVAGNKLSMFPVEVQYRSSLFHMMLRHYPTLTALLANGSCCALCLDPFLPTWLECVHFISLKKVG
ncbi:leucine-rich repeat-containing protein 69 [Anarrhichthys ocellatus]|uniref:leucine-rich repeat-containing protein 69 n=1 Tax=Anarrhichthys ocellatus TaxID=433405 RepID=UPI0012ED8973|nr:leucine-rich repeat-containing protein 69 [Anarrhichthys ocellatus]